MNEKQWTMQKIKIIGQLHDISNEREVDLNSEIIFISFSMSGSVFIHD